MAPAVVCESEKRSDFVGFLVIFCNHGGDSDSGGKKAENSSVLGPLVCLLEKGGWDTAEESSPE